MCESKTLTGLHYIELLCWFDVELEKHGATVKKNLVFHPDNISAHIAWQISLTELGHKLLSHSLYSPDLAPKDF